MFYNDKYPIEFTIGVRELVAMGCVLVDRTTMFGVEYVKKCNSRAGLVKSLN